MPRGAKPGTRNGGGIKKGQKQRRTIEKMALADRIIAEMEGKPGKKLGREILQEFAEMFGGLAAMFHPQPSVPGMPLTPDDIEAWAKSYKEPLFEKYAKLAARVANDFADFQSPRMSRVQVAAPAPPAQAVRKKFSVSIFDGQGRKAPRHIDAKAIAVVTAPQSKPN